MRALDDNWFRACNHKRPYNKRSAKYVVRRLKSQGDSFIAPYRCPFCRRWHVGHFARKQKKAS